jgi:hypothetical protein
VLPNPPVLVKVNVGADDDQKHVTTFFGTQPDTAEGLRQVCEIECEMSVFQSSVSLIQKENKK